MGRTRDRHGTQTALEDQPTTAEGKRLQGGYSRSRRGFLIFLTVIWGVFIVFDIGLSTQAAAVKNEIDHFNLFSGSSQRRPPPQLQGKKSSHQEIQEKMTTVESAHVRVRNRGLYLVLLSSNQTTCLAFQSLRSIGRDKAMLPNLGDVAQKVTVHVIVRVLVPVLVLSLPLSSPSWHL